MAAAKTTKKSDSGFYRVTLKAGVEHLGFFYSPSHDHVVDESILAIFTESGAINTAEPV